MIPLQCLLCGSSGRDRPRPAGTQRHTTQGEWAGAWPNTGAHSKQLHTCSCRIILHSLLYRMCGSPPCLQILKVTSGDQVVAVEFLPPPDAFQLVLMNAELEFVSQKAVRGPEMELDAAALAAHLQSRFIRQVCTSKGGRGPAAPGDAACSTSTHRFMHTHAHFLSTHTCAHRYSEWASSSHLSTREPTT
jgi:hypothetical protein